MNDQSAPTTSSTACHREILRQRRPQILFVALAWLGLVAAGGVYIVHYSVRSPMRDDWTFVSGLTDQAGPWPWLWEPWREAKSRIPVQKTLLYLVWNGNQGDLRPLFLACHLGLALAAAVATVSVAVMRGRCEFSDAFVSLVVLSPANWFNEIEAYRVYTPLYTTLCLLLATSFLFYERYARPTFVAMSCAGLLLLTMQHALGTGASVCFLGGILAAIWFTRGRSTRPKVSAAIGVVTALLWGVYLAFHFRDCIGVGDVQGTLPLVDKLTAALQFLTTSLGTIGRRFWPAAGGGMAVLIAGTAASLATAGLSRRQNQADRTRALLLLFPLASTPLVALGIGSVRDHQGGLQVHYTSYASVLLVFLYMGWQLAFRGQLRAFLQFGAFALLCSATTTEAALSLDRGQRQQQEFEHFRQMAVEDASINRIVSEFGESMASNETVLAAGIAALQRAGLEPFRSIDLSPGEVPLDVPLDQIEMRGMERLKGNRWRGDSSNAHFLIATPAGRPITGLRVRYSLHKSPHRLAMELRWPAADAAFPECGYRAVERPVSFVKGKRMSHEVRTFWTGSLRTDRFSFHPSRTEFEIELHEVSLLLEEDAHATPAER